MEPVIGAEKWLSINTMNHVHLIENSACLDETEALIKTNAADIIELYRRLAA